MTTYTGTYLQDMIARPHPRAPQFWQLWMHFSDGTERPLDQAAYATQPAQHVAESFDLELIMQES